MNWERIAAITEDGQKYTEYISRMESNNNTFKIIVNRKFPRETNEKKQLEHFEKVNIDVSTLVCFFLKPEVFFFLFLLITHYLLSHTQVTQRPQRNESSSYNNLRYSRSSFNEAYNVHGKQT